VDVGVQVSEDEDGAPPPLPPSSLYHHSPYNTPTLRSAKNWNRPSDISRPPLGQPGHSSMMVAVVVNPLAVIVMLLKQLGPGYPLPYKGVSSATMKSLATFV